MNECHPAIRSLACNAASAARAAQATSYLRILALLLALVALSIQALAVQTHLHHTHAARLVQADSLNALFADQRAAPSSDAQRPGDPDNDDPSKCPLCQQMGHSWHLSTNAPNLFSSCVFAIISVIAFSEGAVTFTALRHSWQSRAPPKE